VKYLLFEKKITIDEAKDELKLHLSPDPTIRQEKLKAEVMEAVEMELDLDGEFEEPSIQQDEDLINLQESDEEINEEIVSEMEEINAIELAPEIDEEIDSPEKKKSDFERQWDQDQLKNLVLARAKLNNMLNMASEIQTRYQ
jgi:hypothetical protein